MSFESDHGQDAFADVSDRLERARPTLDPDARAALVSRVSRPAPAAVRSRALIVAMLVCGLGFSGGGAALAVSGVGGPGATASQAQYDPNGSTPGATTSPAPDANEVLGSSESGGSDPSDSSDSSDSGDPSDSGVAGSEDSGNGSSTGTGTSGASDPAQATRQLSTSSGDASATLPFTGLAALPIIVFGLFLLAAGLLLRRRTALPPR